MVLCDENDIKHGRELVLIGWDEAPFLIDCLRGLRPGTSYSLGTGTIRAIVTTVLVFVCTSPYFVLLSVVSVQQNARVFLSRPLQFAFVKCELHYDDLV